MRWGPPSQHTASWLVLSVPRVRAGRNIPGEEWLKKLGISWWERGGSHRPRLGPVWVQMDPAAPLATLDKRPDALGNTASTVECTEPPTPPRHLFSISEDGPVLSTPGKQFLRNCSRRGGAPGNLPEASSTYADRPPLLRQTQQ